MLNTNDYLQLDAIALSQGLRNKDFTCCEIMETALSRAIAVNPIINAINVENYENATQQAQQIDQHISALDQSALAGLPFLIKDLSPVKGLETTYGSTLFKGVNARANSNIVRRYLDAGLIVIGKTNTPEWGLTLTTEPQANGVTRNPWNLDYSTGGSSGGAAAAVAAGIIPVAHATDGGGSIRIPAANCGLVGLKPSRGLTAIEDEFGACWSGMSVGHVVSQTVRDSAAFLDLITLQDAKLFPKPAKPDSFLNALNPNSEPLRIAVQRSHPLGQKVDPQCIAALDKAAEYCDALGHHVEDVVHPADYKSATWAMGKLIGTHIFQAVAPRLDELGVDIEDSTLESSTKMMAMAGSRVSATDYLKAIDTLKSIENTMKTFHDQFDVVLSPVLSLPPATLGWLDMNSDNLQEYGERFKQYSGFTAIYNGTGQPSLSLPLHITEDNLPIGVMFTAGWGRDSLLLQLAKQIESAYPWPKRAPEL